MLVTEAGRLMELSEEQSRKVASPMLVTEAGRLMELSEEQL